MIRLLAILILALSLSATAVAEAVARGGPPATDSIVICVGDQTKRIYVDAEGQPTTSPHHCPDCFVGPSLNVPGFALAVRHLRAGTVGAIAMQSDAESVPHVSKLARGPPAMI